MEANRVNNNLLREPVKVVNVGLELFYRSLRDQAAEAVQVEWRRPAGGNERLAGLLDRLSGRRPS